MVSLAVLVADLPPPRSTGCIDRQRDNKGTEMPTNVHGDRF
jgi:hypothetical protein